MRLRLVTSGTSAIRLATAIGLAYLGISASKLPAQPANQGGGQTGGNSASLKNSVSITIQGDKRVIKANGVPDHPMGQFPNRNNPNRLAAQDYNYTIPLHPQVAEKTTRLRMQPIGIALNGIVFDPAAAEWWDNDPFSGWQYEPLSGAINLGVDQSNAHIQPNGAYHYHGVPHGLITRLTGGKPAMVQIGWAADGFPIYGPWGFANSKDAKSEVEQVKSSYRVKQGTRNGGPGGKYDGSFVEDYEYVAGLGDLDECNGRFGVTPEFPEGIYHYYITGQYPYIPRYFRGTPDSSFERHGPPGGPGGLRGRGNRPPGPPPFGGGPPSQN